jgi:mersacidin/lichenicidin family type 2 lantibiotic
VIGEPFIALSKRRDRRSVRMSIDLIEAAWTDPILRSELLESEEIDIPAHPAGLVSSPKSDPVPRIDGYSYTPSCLGGGNSYGDITVYSFGPCCF